MKKSILTQDQINLLFNSFELKLEVFENFFITIKLNESMDGYSFKTPKGCGGRHYYSFANCVDKAMQEQYSDIYWTIHNNIRNS